MFDSGHGVNTAMVPVDEDRRRRLNDLESKIRDVRSIINVDCLGSILQNSVSAENFSDKFSFSNIVPPPKKKT
jgi:hypothetical protein